MMVNYLKTEILQFQSHANPLRLSSLRGRVRDSAFSAYRFLIPTPQIRDIQIDKKKQISYKSTLQNILRIRNII